MQKWILFSACIILFSSHISIAQESCTVEKNTKIHLKPPKSIRDLWVHWHELHGYYDNRIIDVSLIYQLNKVNDKKLFSNIEVEGKKVTVALGGGMYFIGKMEGEQLFKGKMELTDWLEMEGIVRTDKGVDVTHQNYYTVYQGKLGSFLKLDMFFEQALRVRSGDSRAPLVYSDGTGIKLTVSPNSFTTDKNRFYFRVYGGPQYQLVGEKSDPIGGHFSTHLGIDFF